MVSPNATKSGTTFAKVLKRANGSSEPRRMTMSRSSISFLAFVTLLAHVQLSFAANACVQRPGAARSVSTLEATMTDGRFIAYHPTSLQLIDGAWTEADGASMRDDLALLRKRFDGLITYSAAHGADRVADVAAELHYRAVILGVWNI